jgi:hypothetical protein
VGVNSLKNKVFLVDLLAFHKIFRIFKCNYLTFKIELISGVFIQENRVSGELFNIEYNTLNLVSTSN